jgi:hypothetical protein
MMQPKDMPHYVLKFSGKFKNKTRVNYHYAYNRADAREIVKQRKANGWKLVSCLQAFYQKAKL